MLVRVSGIGVLRVVGGSVDRFFWKCVGYDLDYVDVDFMV